eukprot:6602444-Alexandrium_andersonii.AAC.1
MAGAQRLRSSLAGSRTSVARRHRRRAARATRLAGRPRLTCARSARTARRVRLAGPSLAGH